MSRREEKLSDVLLKAPWWVSVILAVIVFIGLRWVAPVMLANTQIGKGISVSLSAMAPYPAVFLLLIAGASAVLAAKKRKLVDTQTSLESVRSLGWKEFELMVAEAYRREGYAVDYSVGGGADGGIDVLLRKGAETVLVQCKQWKVFSVGAPVIREIFGLLAHHQASRAIVITCGKFTADAHAFAAGKPIELVDGPALLRLVQGVQPKGTQTIVPSVSTSSAQVCHKCSSAMVMRTAKRGANAGNSFWGSPPTQHATERAISSARSGPDRVRLKLATNVVEAPAHAPSDAG